MAVQESTQELNELSTQQTTQTSAQQATEISTQQTVLVSGGEQTRDIRGLEEGEISSRVVGQTVTGVQENMTLSLECVQTLTETTEVYNSSSREGAQTSTQETSTALERATTKSEQHGFQESLNVVSSSVHDVLSATTQETAQGTTVEAGSIENKQIGATLSSSEATELNQSGEIMHDLAKEIIH